MSPQISGVGCAQNCCRNSLAQGIAKPVTSAKSNPGRTAHFVPAAQRLSAAAPAFAVALRTGSDATAPPRYILLRVFRV
jgi:hypothetical protein